MKLPSRIIDISSTLDNETVMDHDLMRPKIEYVDNKGTVEDVCKFFPGLKPTDLPDSEAWSWERINLVTHNGTRRGDPLALL